MRSAVARVKRARSRKPAKAKELSADGEIFPQTGLANLQPGQVLECETPKTTNLERRRPRRPAPWPSGPQSEKGLASNCLHWPACEPACTLQGRAARLVGEVDRASADAQQFHGREVV